MAKYIGNYEVIRELGSGQFGTVYLGVGTVPGRGLSAGRRRLVALKQLKEGATDSAAELLEQEFSLLDQVKHRCIVRVFEYLKDEKTVVMEYVHGVDLRTLLEECGSAREQIFTEAAVEICCEMADALYQAWTTPSDNGEPLELVHRDLKPANIILTSSGDVKILDFGLACVHNSEWAEEETGRIRGTPLYMSPEHARGEAVDHRSDLFAVGLIAYELFTNRPAYTVPTNSKDPLSDVYDAIEAGALMEEVSELESKLPAVGPILAKLLQFNPRSRYQDGQGLMVDLRRQLYRDRGAYLKEFCEFFFDVIYELSDAPEVSSFKPTTGPTKRKLSIAERLKMSSDMAASGDKVERASDDFLIATPLSASTDEPKQKVQPVGHRPPDETGMLQMFSLDEAPSATEETGFMDLKALRQRAEAPAEEAPQIQKAPAQSPPPVAKVVKKRVVASPAGGGTIGGPTISGPTISGPTISGPTGASPTEARSAGNAAPPPPSSSSNRTKSNRIYAVILGIVALVGGAVIFAVQQSGDSESTTEVSGVTSSSSSSSSGSSGSTSSGSSGYSSGSGGYQGGGDGGYGDGDVVDNSRSSSGSASSSGGSSGSYGGSASSSSGGRSRSSGSASSGSGSSASSGSSGSSGSSSGSSGASVASGTMTVNISDFGASPPLRVVVKCDGQTIGRSSFDGATSVSVAGVPAASCQLRFQGASGGTATVQGGALSVSCSWSSGSVECR